MKCGALNKTLKLNINLQNESGKTSQNKKKKGKDCVLRMKFTFYNLKGIVHRLHRLWWWIFHIRLQYSMEKQLFSLQNQIEGREFFMKKQNRFFSSFTLRIRLIYDHVTLFCFLNWKLSRKKRFIMIFQPFKQQDHSFRWHDRVSP